MKKPTVFRCVILPYLVISIFGPIITLIILSFCLGSEGISFDNLGISAYIFIGLIFTFSLLMGIPLMKTDYRDYKNKLFDWEYHQITWDEYLKERGKLK